MSTVLFPGITGHAAVVMSKRPHLAIASPPAKAPRRGHGRRRSDSVGSGAGPQSPTPPGNAVTPALGGPAQPAQRANVMHPRNRYGLARPDFVALARKYEEFRK